LLFIVKIIDRYDLKQDDNYCAILLQDNRFLLVQHGQGILTHPKFRSMIVSGAGIKIHQDIALL
jgi:hypothetical protein